MIITSYPPATTQRLAGFRHFAIHSLWKSALALQTIDMVVAQSVRGLSEICVTLTSSGANHFEKLIFFTGPFIACCLYAIFWHL
jgi:hypothetical protein